jgi:hypothetical protein
MHSLPPRDALACDTRTIGTAQIDAVIRDYDAAGNVITMSTVAKLEADRRFSD